MCISDALRLYYYCGRFRFKMWFSVIFKPSRVMCTMWSVHVVYGMYFITVFIVVYWVTLHNIQVYS